MRLCGLGPLPLVERDDEEAPAPAHEHRKLPPSSSVVQGDAVVPSWHRSLRRGWGLFSVRLPNACRCSGSVPLRCLGAGLLLGRACGQRG
ncbi:MAG: hypothetical protein ACK559_00165, partial [bacterium]